MHQFSSVEWALIGKGLLIGPTAPLAQRALQPLQISNIQRCLSFTHSLWHGDLPLLVIEQGQVPVPITSQYYLVRLAGIWLPPFCGQQLIKASNSFELKL